MTSIKEAEEYEPLGAFRKKYIVEREWNFNEIPIHIHCMFCGFHFYTNHESIKLLRDGTHMRKEHPFELDILERSEKDAE